LEEKGDEARSCESESGTASVCRNTELEIQGGGNTGNRGARTKKELNLYNET